MLDLSIGEIVVVAVVSLLVLGPERLPNALRKVVALFKRSKDEINSIRSQFTKDLNIENELAELKQELYDMQRQSKNLLMQEKEQLKQVEEELTETFTEIESEVSQITSDASNKPTKND